MPSFAKFLLFIFFLPFLATVGHDVYINYLSTDEKVREVKNMQIDPKEFMMSDAGWTWQRYSPGTMQLARDSVDQEDWKEKIDPVLEQPTLFVTLVPFATILVLTVLFMFIKLITFSAMSFTPKARMRKHTVYKHDKANPMKFSKK